MISAAAGVAPKRALPDISSPCALAGELNCVPIRANSYGKELMCLHADPTTSRLLGLFEVNDPYAFAYALWDTNTGKCLKSGKMGGNMFMFSAMKSGTYVLGTEKSHGEVEMFFYRGVDGERISKMTVEFTHWVLSADGRKLVAAPFRAKPLSCWDVATTNSLWNTKIEYKLLDEIHGRMECSAQALALVSEDQNIHVYNVENGTHIYTVELSGYETCTPRLCGTALKAMWVNKAPNSYGLHHRPVECGAWDESGVAILPQWTLAGCDATTHKFNPATCQSHVPPEFIGEDYVCAFSKDMFHIFPFWPQNGGESANVMRELVNSENIKEKLWWWWAEPVTVEEGMVAMAGQDRMIRVWQPKTADASKRARLST